jgi:hypothetical protein
MSKKNTGHQCKIFPPEVIQKKRIKKVAQRMWRKGGPVLDLSEALQLAINMIGLTEEGKC